MLTKIILFHCIVLLLFSANLLMAQQDLWITFTSSEGLADNTVHALCESKNGILWIGTDDGASSYVNGDWVTFNKDSGFVSNTINTIYESSDQVLWFGTDNGVTYYRDDIWGNITTANGLVNDDVKTIIESKDGTLWFGTSGGVSYYRNNTWDSLTTVDGLVDDQVLTICETYDTALWFGTPNGVSRYDGESWITLTTANGLSANNVCVIYETSDSTLWFGTSGGGVCRCKEGKWETLTTTDGLVNDNIQAIYESSDGIVWIGTKGGGISQYMHGILHSISALDHKLANNNVASIIETGDGALWFGTAMGVSRYLPEIWKTYTTTDGLPDNEIFTICKSRNNALWFGTDKGICCYENETWSTFPSENGLTSYKTTAIIETKDSTIWIGTWGGGICYFHDGNWGSITYVNSLVDDWVNCIFESKDSILWFGTWNGINRYQQEILDTITIAEGLVDNSINTICETNDSTFFIGTTYGGNLYRDAIYDTITTADGLVDNAITSIIEANDGSLWFATCNGVSRHQDGIWSSFTKSNGLADNYVNAIFQSDDGALWFASKSGGISHFKDHIWTTFTTIDGLCDNEVNAINQSADGKMWFGTAQGVSRFKADKNPPFITITKSPGRITGDPSPFFAFSGKDYQTATHQITFSHALTRSGVEPRDNDYSVFSGMPFTELSSLQNGGYSFYVRARDRMGNISKPAIYHFSVDVTPPTVVINSPVQNATYSQIVTIMGSAYDDSPRKDFDYYGLCFGKGNEVSSVTKWDTLVTNIRQEVRNDTLATWNTMGLQGGYLLKLFAKDNLGHESDDVITIHMVDVTGEIKNQQGGHISDLAHRIDLYFPPRCLCDNAEIQISFISDLDEDTINTERYRYTGLAYDIMPSSLTLYKPATLIISYADSFVQSVADDRQLSIFTYDESNDEWDFVGGTVDADQNKITTAIDKLGRYGLFESFIAGVATKIKDLNCQPRIFSPGGGGYDNQTTISFELGKETNVTIKVYNAAGRLVRLLTENEKMSHGNNAIAWDGKDEQDKFCTSGLYIMTIQAGDKIAKKTVVVLNK